MTENEAIKELLDYVAENDKLTISIETVTLARKALEELKQYRAIGTMEELKDKSNCKDCAGCTLWKCDCANERARAIDDFVERLSYKIKSEIDDCADELEWIEKIAKQLKGE